MASYTVVFEGVGNFSRGSTIHWDSSTRMLVASGLAPIPMTQSAAASGFYSGSFTNHLVTMMDGVRDDKSSLFGALIVPGSRIDQTGTWGAEATGGPEEDGDE